MSKLASRIERLERRTPARKIPSDDSALALWAIESLFPSQRTGDEPTTYIDGEPSPYLVFLDLVKSGAVAAEAKRRGILFEKDEPPAWQKKWLEEGAGKWSDEIEINPRQKGSVAPY